MENFFDRGIKFPDASFYQAIRRDQYNNLLPLAQQKPINFEQMKSAGIPAVVLRAGQDYWVDSEFRVSWENAAIAGLKRATYFFLDKDGDPKTQARFYWDIIKSDPGEGFISGDVEYGSHTIWDKWYQFFNELQQASGYPSERIYFYTNLNTWQTYGPKDPAQQAWFARYGLWLAAWNNTIPNIIVPAGLKTPRLLQYATPTIGYSLGVWSREIDMNLLNGGQTEFEQIFGKTSIPTTPEEPPIVIVNPPAVVVTGRKYQCTATAGLNIRPSQGTVQAPIGVLRYQEVVDEVSINSDGTWIQIKTLSGVVGWCFATYLKLITQTPPVEEPAPTDGYWYFMHDWQCPPLYKIRTINTLSGGTPAVVRYGKLNDVVPSTLEIKNSYGTRIDRAWQFFIMDIASKSVFGRYHGQLTSTEYNWLASKITGVFGQGIAFMNNAGMDIRRNYLTNKRMDQELPVMFNLVCTGMSGRGTVVKNANGIDMIKLDYFDATMPPPDVRSIDIATDPRIFMAANIKNKQIEGGYSVFRFHQFSEPTRGIYRDVPVPLISNFAPHYVKAKLKWIPGKKFSPYFPPR